MWPIRCWYIYLYNFRYRHVKSINTPHPCCMEPTSWMNCCKQRTIYWRLIVMGHEAKLPPAGPITSRQQLASRSLSYRIQMNSMEPKLFPARTDDGEKLTDQRKFHKPPIGTTTESFFWGFVVEGLSPFGRFAGRSYFWSGEPTDMHECDRETATHTDR